MGSAEQLAIFFYQVAGPLFAATAGIILGFYIAWRLIAAAIEAFSGD